jgi:nicotinamidase-related amidase
VSGIAEPDTSHELCREGECPHEPRLQQNRVPRSVDLPKVTAPSHVRYPAGSDTDDPPGGAAHARGQRCGATAVGGLTGALLPAKLRAAVNTNTMARPRRIARIHAGLMVVDIQERLFPAMCERESMLQNALRLVQGAAILRLPVFVTEQYPKGLGPTVAEIARPLADHEPVEKNTFSAWGVPGFAQRLQSRGVSEVILCGIEAHVCVAQTCLDLLDAGLRAFVVRDAVSSRTPENRQAGLERMRDAGAIVVSTEMVLFEWLERAGTEEFKQIQRLIK